MDALENRGRLSFWRERVSRRKKQKNLETDRDFEACIAADDKILANRENVTGPEGTSGNA